MSFWPVVKRVVKDADIVVEVLDSRMPDLSRNLEVERLIRREGKKLVMVFNKRDLISQKRLVELKEKHKDSFFVSGINNIGISKLKTELLILGKRIGKKEPLIGFVGYPNTGKSAIINALSKRNKAKVSDIAGTTKGMQWINAGSLRIIDSPGVIPVEDREVNLGLLGAKNPEKIKNLERVAFYVIKQFLDSKSKELEKFYKFEIEENMDEYDILLEIGKSRGFLKKGGLVEENRTSMQIVKDWRSGKLSI